LNTMISKLFKDGNKDAKGLKKSGFSMIASRFGVFFMIVVLLIIGGIVSKGFFTGRNFLNILNAVSYLGIVATGIAFVLYAGQFAEMSTPMTMAISGVICVEFMRYGLFWGVFAAICTGIVIGLINGFVVGRLRVNTVIWTMAMNFILEGLVRWSYHGNQIYPDMATAQTYESGFFLPLIYKLDPNVLNIDLVPKAAAFNGLAKTYILGVPLVLYVMVAVMIVGYVIMSKTRFGAQLKIVGSNYNVAKLSGINVTRVVQKTFILCSIFASISGIFLTSLNQVGAFYVGQGYDFQAVTAIILGGMSLAGGRGTMVGVFGGVFTLGLISNILTLIGVGTFTQKMITGVIFIIVVAVNARSLRKLGRDYV